MARKWRKVAALGRRRITFQTPNGAIYSGGCSGTVVEKGHFVVYTTDGRRFVVPLAYLNNPIFTELFNMSEDEFGLPGNEPITLPCEAIFMDYVVALV
ncbi:auxin-responsive protein SAUR36-like [Tasmannia lanceolata]|uniref:auxin-responsive protein SAUR36-like n=1 Tax=Tasmannia lanceolata TaxID=3420 RepID=UPI00406446ED